MEKPFDLPAFKKEVGQLTKAGMLPEFAADLEPVSLEDLDDLKRRYAATIIQLDRLRPRLGTADAHARSDNNGWSLRETLGHLIDADQDIWWPRIEAILQEDGPMLPNIDQEELLRAHHWQSHSLEEVLLQFVRARWNYAMRLQSVLPQEFERTGTHEVLGELSILRIIQLLVAHDEHYLATIRAMLDGME